MGSINWYGAFDEKCLKAGLKYVLCVLAATPLYGVVGMADRLRD